MRTQPATIHTLLLHCGILSWNRKCICFTRTFITGSKCSSYYWLLIKINQSWLELFNPVLKVLVKGIGLEFNGIFWYFSSQNFVFTSVPNGSSWLLCSPAVTCCASCLSDPVNFVFMGLVIGFCTVNRPPHFEKIDWVSDNQIPDSAGVHDSNDTCYTSAIWSLVVGNGWKLHQ